MSSSDQSLLLKALQNPNIFDHSINEFRLLETHISWVLLTGDYAYKIKKPVDFGFLDFSTLEKRCHYCREELRLNGRLAPDIYQDVIKITGSEQTPEINGAGPVIEYAVKMRQFPQDSLLITMLETGNLTAEYIDQLAEVIAGFHDKIQTSASDTHFGTAETVLAPVTENFLQIRQFTGTEFEMELARLEDWSLKEHQRRYTVFEQRKREGFNRECHGDLHLGNIVIHKGKITLFDGIEFNQNLYWIDVISEIAFLVMDLEDHQRSDLAYRVLNAYLQQTGDYGGLAVLRYYLVYRAMVRAKVNSIRLNQPGSDEGLAESREQYIEYLKLAESYTRPSKPRLIICHGLSGSGKTTVSQKMLEAIPAIRIRSDVERKRLHGLQEKQASGSEVQGGIYTADANRLTYQRLLELSGIIIDAGYTAIIDAAFLKNDQRQPFKSLAWQLDIPFLIVHCQADENILRHRISARDQQGGDASEAGLSILEYQLKNQEGLFEEELTDCEVIATDTEIDIEPVLNWIDRTA